MRRDYLKTLKLICVVAMIALIIAAGKMSAQARDDPDALFNLTLRFGSEAAYTQ